MREAKRINGRGAVTAEALGPADFAVGGGKSRAAARMLVEEKRREAERLQSTQRVKGPRRKPDFDIKVTQEKLPYGGADFTFQFIPKNMSVAEARRWVEENGGTGDKG